METFAGTYVPAQIFEPITDERGLQRFIAAMVEYRCAFHWEDRPCDIVESGGTLRPDGTRSDMVKLFTPSQCTLISKRLDELWEVADDLDICPFEFDFVIQRHDYEDEGHSDLHLGLKSMRAQLMTFRADQIHTEWMHCEPHMGDPEYLEANDLDFSTTKKIVDTMMESAGTEQDGLEWLEGFTARMIRMGWWRD